MILDIHHHAIQINDDFESPYDLQYLNKQKAFFYKTWLKFVGLEWNDDSELMNRHLIEKQINIIEESYIDHFVMIPLDDRYDIDGNKMSEKSILRVSNERVLSIAKLSEKIIPAYSIHPYRKDALEQVEEAVRQSAALIKWLPGIQGFDPTSKEAIAVAQKCANNDMPMLVHFGQEFSFPGQEMVKKYHKLKNVEKLLETGCKIIVPHFGGFSLLRKGKRHKYLEDLIDRYDNLFFDNSATLSPMRTGDMVKLIKKTEKILSRTAFGTDFPVYSHTTALLRNLGLKNYAEIKKDKNPLNRDVKVKKVLGFDETTFENGYHLISEYAKENWITLPE